MLDRRTVLLALAGLAATPAAADTPADADGARRVGRAYIDAHPTVRLDRARLQADLLPDGWNDNAAKLLRARVAADFRNGRLWVHKGWRLSDTEGRLFALAALS